MVCAEPPTSINSSRKQLEQLVLFHDRQFTVGQLDQRFDLLVLHKVATELIRAISAVHKSHQAGSSVACWVKVNTSDSSAWLTQTLTLWSIPPEQRGPGTDTHCRSSERLLGGPVMVEPASKPAALILLFLLHNCLANHGTTAYFMLLIN